MFKQPNEDHVAILVGDDRGGAPLLLYVGEKRGGNFLERNGLASGSLYIWVGPNGFEDADDFLGTGTSLEGTFKKIKHYRPDLADKTGECDPAGGRYDSLGYANQKEQDCLADAAGAFRFSRPEDVSTNPYNDLQAVLHSTGRVRLFSNEKWGQTLLVEVDYVGFTPEGDEIAAKITIAYDGNDNDKEDFGIRSPDNGVWASDGFIYGKNSHLLRGCGAKLRNDKISQIPSILSFFELQSRKIGLIRNSASLLKKKLPFGASIPERAMPSASTKLTAMRNSPTVRKTPSRTTAGTGRRLASLT